MKFCEVSLTALVVTHTCHLTADWSRWSTEQRLSVIRNVTQAPGAALAGGHMVWWRLLVSINIDIVVKKTRPKHVEWHDSFLQISKWMFAKYSYRW